LILGRTVVVMVVEPGFADRHDRRGRTGAQPVEGGRNVGGCALGLVRMDADRRVQGVGFGGTQRALAVGKVTADRDDRGNPSHSRPVERGFAVVVVLSIVNVRVRVDHQRRCSKRETPRTFAAN